MSHKRAAESQLTRDDDGEGRADDDFVTTPQVADTAAMATRRVVKVRRPEGGSSSSATTGSGSSTGFFKDAATAASNAAPAKPAFGFGFGFGANSTSSTDKTATTTNAFSFGGTTTTAGSAKPTFSFPSTVSTSTAALSLGPKSEGSTSATAAPPTFSFGAAAPASGDAAKKPTTGFSFGGLTSTMNTTATTANTTASSASSSAEDKETAKATAPTDEKKAVFGAGSFNFGSAVNSFVAARAKMQEEAKETKTNQEGSEATAAVDGHDEDKPDPAGFGSEIVEQTARDVLVTAPSKLYVFEKGDEGKAGRWAERGVGDAKLISQPKEGEDKGHIYRLLVRGGYSLNATIKKNTLSLSKAEAKHLILLVATADGPQTYLLKFTGPSAEANTTRFSEELKKVLAEVSKAE